MFALTALICIKAVAPLVITGGKNVNTTFREKNKVIHKAPYTMGHYILGRWLYFDFYLDNGVCKGNKAFSSIEGWQYASIPFFCFPTQPTALFWWWNCVQHGSRKAGDKSYHRVVVEVMNKKQHQHTAVITLAFYLLRVAMAVVVDVAAVDIQHEVGCFD